MSKLRVRKILPEKRRSTYFPFEGGVNIVDPSLALKPGELAAADNFEIDIRGRYRRIDGYERFDGRELPSAVSYYKMPFITGTSKAKTFSIAYSTAFRYNIPSVGDIIKGETSGALGSILAVVIEDVTGSAASGSFSAGDAEGNIYFTVTSGTFQDGETLFFLHKDSAFGAAFFVGFK